jgi:hypothetical protein
MKKININKVLMSKLSSLTSSINLNFKSFVCPISLNSPYFERPTPLIFICGEGLSCKIWNDTAEYCSNRGFESIIVEIPSDITNIDSASDFLDNFIKFKKMTPPIVISHSLSSFISQKFLESFSLTGLIMVNPIPPSPNRSSASMLSLYNAKKGNLLSYYGVEDNNNNNNNIILKDSYFPSKLLNSLCVDSSSSLNLEAGAVPTLIITSEGDYNMDILHNNEKDSLLYSFCQDDDNIIHLSNELTRLPMLNSNFYEIIYNWIDINN